MNAKHFFCIITIFALSSLLFACVSPGIKKEKIYAEAAETEESVQAPQEPETEEAKPEHDLSELTDFLENDDSEKEEIGKRYIAYLKCHPRDAARFVSELKRDILEKDKTHLAEICLTLIRNERFEKLNSKAREILLEIVLDLAYDKDDEVVREFAENHVGEDFLIELINKNYFVLHKIREYAYSRHKKAAERVYDRIMLSPRFHDLSERVRQWEVEELWKIYEEHPELRDKINDIWAFLYSPENFAKLEQKTGYRFLDALIEKVGREESGNIFLEDICSELLKREVLENLTSENRVYVLYNLFSYVSEHDFFRKIYFDSLLDRKLVFREKADIEWYKDIYLSFGEYMNYTHDVDGNWAARLAGLLRGRSDRELYFFMSAASYDLYNATFTLLYREQVERVRMARGLFPWLEKVDRKNKLVSMFFLSLSARNTFIEFIKGTAHGREREQINPILKKTCDLIRKETETHSQSDDFDSRKYLSYISYAVGDLFGYGDPEISAYLTALIVDLTQGNFLSNIFARTIIKKYPGFFSDHRIRRSDVDRLIESVIAYLEKPPYDSLIKKDGKVYVLVDFSDTAEDFIYGQKEVLGPGSMIEPDEEQLRKGIVAVHRRYISGIPVEYHIAKDVIGEAFRKVVDENTYSLIFTRHHSYENDLFIGQGSDIVIPQIWSNVNIGYGKINSYMGLVLTEEVIKAYVSGRKSWDRIIEKVEPRVRARFNEADFLYPNDLPLIISYISLLAEEDYAFDRNKVIFFDGGCAGSVRSLKNIDKYKNSMVRD